MERLPSGEFQYSNPPVICPKCGIETSDYANICPGCGRIVNSPFEIKPRRWYRIRARQAMVLLVYSAIPCLWLAVVLLGNWWPGLGRVMRPATDTAALPSSERFAQLAAYRRQVLGSFQPSNAALEPYRNRWESLLEGNRQAARNASVLSRSGYLRLDRAKPPAGLEKAHGQLEAALSRRAEALKALAEGGTPSQPASLAETLNRSFTLYKAGLSIISEAERNISAR